MKARLLRARTVAAWVLLVGSIIGWPLSQLTIARGEPPFTLGLSWLAVLPGQVGRDCVTSGSDV